MSRHFQKKGSPMITIFGFLRSRKFQIKPLFATTGGGGGRGVAPLAPLLQTKTKTKTNKNKSIYALLLQNIRTSSKYAISIPLCNLYFPKNDQHQNILLICYINFPLYSFLSKLLMVFISLHNRLKHST